MTLPDYSEHFIIGLGLLGGAIFLVAVSGPPIYFAVAGEGWSESTAQVYAARIKRRGWHTSSGNGEHFSPVIFYSYEVDGVEYSSDVYSYVEPHFSTREEVESILAQFEIGLSVPIYYDPDDPARAALNRDWRIGFMNGLGLIGAAYLLRKVGQEIYKVYTKIYPIPSYSIDNGQR